ncbi:hypothetical protein GCM10007862_21060 [Dyella lipolytica]|uniref:Uncharacterized protein n=1 Tax=Dyella lipolytica TaxID=1867835 RepID=A0ABW8IQX3_9GAMM|nr:hypothetical protein [Dyella lipolytica]GLQ47055.1 hypothetical protein GCM10007862_21060 [Dyella lipolytica]
MRQWKWMLGLLFVVSPLLAQDIPPALRDWQGWVLHNAPQHACPFLANSNPDSGSYQCLWPGRLALDAGKGGGHFSLDVHVDAAGWVDLPGDERSWPQQVSVNDKAWPVLNHDEHPALRLEPGDYTVQGTLPWETRPARVRVPLAVGLVSLSLDGNAVGRIERNGDQLTLGEAAAAQRQADALSVRVYRHLTDGMPAMLDTQLQLNATGSAREQLLGPALPKGFVATSLDSELPAQLESDGRLRLQLRPGQWTVRLSARGTDTLHDVSLTLPADPWPKQEVWSYTDNPELRSTHVNGHATDAAQAGVPQEWRELPAYVLDNSDGLAVEQGTRGGEGGAGDQIHLQREIWLDFDGRGLNVSDHLTGTLQHTQRLDVGAPWQLQRAMQRNAPLLVTDAGDGRTGVELRDTNMDLHAGLRVADRSGALPSAGWLASLENIDAVLHLPYGYRLIGASGVDRSPDSWVAHWSLLDLFVVALIALLAGRLLGWPWAVLAALFLILSLHEAGAPRWTLGLALALALLMRALPAGRLRWVAQIASTLALALAVLWTLPFAKTQLEDALHPQLESESGYAALMQREAAADYGGSNARAKKAEVAPAEEPSESGAAPAPPPPAAPTAMLESAPVSASNRSLATVTVTSTALPGAAATSEVDSHSIIQAGAGEPSWDVDNNYRLGWSGPVAPGQSTRLVIAPAWLVRLLRVVMLGLLIVLLGHLARGLIKPFDTSWRNGRLGRAAAACLLFACLPHAGHAQTMPSPDLLRQLQSRLLEAPKCAPDCAVVATANLQAKDDQIALELEVHVGAPIALPLPQVDAGLQLVGVNVDGHAGATISKRNDQTLARLEPGVHRIDLVYRAQPTDSTTLNFVLRPQWMVFGGQGWSLDGVDDGRLLGDSVTLNRIRTVADGKQAPLPQQTFPPYVRLTRNIVMGVDWTVINTVERIAPSDGGFSLDLPLLPGEHPLGDSARVHDGRIGVTFNAGESEVTWTSRLDHADTLKIEAPALGDRAEVWQLNVSPIWHVETKGVPVGNGGYGVYFEPLPNETLQLTVSRPKAIDGDSLAFDTVNASASVGDRATETALDLLARSTRGGEHAIVLPIGTELLDASRDDEPLSLAVKDGKLSLPILPGKHRYAIRLREPHGVGMHIATSAFALGAPSANIELNLKLPEDRWVLWTWGPGVGPAVLYWSQLVVLLLAAWLLSRYAPTPLRFHHWLLLGLGFSAFAWSAYAFVVLWLILLGLRAQHDTAVARLAGMKFNLLQAVLAAVTVLALAVLVSAVPKGLLGLPDMHVTGNGSTAWSLSWFADQAKDALPQAGVFSVSLWFYKIAMLAWALWLANALIGWLRWGFDAWTKGGYWKKREPKQPAAPPVPVTPGVESQRDA